MLLPLVIFCLCQFSSSDNLSSSPSRIGRVRSRLTGTKNILPAQFEDTPQIFTSYRLSLRWSDPFVWNDNSSESDARQYDFKCNLAAPYNHTLVSGRTPYGFTGYAEHYRFADEALQLNVSVDCAARAINADGMEGPWTYAKPLVPSTVPVYFQGTSNIDLRSVPDDTLLKWITEAETSI